jgi:hypothetical protein
MRRFHPRLPALLPGSLLGFLALILTGIPANAQGNPGTNLTVRLEIVSVQRAGDTIQVSYVAHNSPTSREPLWALTIDAPAEPFAISEPAPAKDWLVYTRYGDRPVVNWASLLGSMAQPGASSPTLSFKAIGLPSIVDAYIEGYYDPPNVDTPEGDAVLGDALETHSVRVRTVGVGPIGAEATPMSLTARLAGLTTESCKLAWISSPSVCNSLGGKLQQASQALTHGHNHTPRLQLQSFLSELDAQHDSMGTLPVKDNAYWLLKVNGEYVLGLIRQPRPVARPK